MGQSRTLRQRYGQLFRALTRVTHTLIMAIKEEIHLMSEGNRAATFPFGPSESTVRRWRRQRQELSTKEFRGKRAGGSGSSSPRHKTNGFFFKLSGLFLFIVAISLGTGTVCSYVFNKAHS